MYTSEPKYFDFTKYKTTSELLKDINTNIINDLYLSDISNPIKNNKDITKGEVFLHLSYNADYYCALVEKCVFVGYLFNKLDNISDSIKDDSNFTLLFHSLDLQNNIELSLKDIPIEIYSCKDKEKIVNSIKSYFTYYKDLKMKVFDKLGKVNKVISLLNEIRVLDEKEILSGNLKKFSDVFPEDNLFNNTINNLIAMNELYYKSNNICSLEGLKNDSGFIKELKDMVNNQTKELLGIKDKSNDIEEEYDEEDDDSHTNTQLEKFKQEERERIEDNKRLF